MYLHSSPWLVGRIDKCKKKFIKIELLWKPVKITQLKSRKIHSKVHFKLNNLHILYVKNISIKHCYLAKVLILISTCKAFAE